MSRHEIKKLMEEIEREIGRLPRDLHITRMCCALVAVSNGRVTKVTQPKLTYCPLRSSLYKLCRAECLSLRKAVARGVEQKIAQFGHFTEKREILRGDVAVPFGASEMMMYALKKGRIDATVTVCDGVGTVVTSNPSLVQGIGARMTGVFYTSPIEKVMEKVRKAGGYIVFPKTAEINQVNGLEEAVKLKYKRIAVTVNGYAGESLEEVRNIERKYGVSVTILTVCTTGVDEERAREIAEHSDLVWGCASLHVREAAGGRAKLQLGVKIPVFILSRKGLELVESYASEEFKKYVKEGKYLVTHSPGGKEHVKIRMGNFTAYLQRVESLPVRGRDEPKPLT